MKWRFSNAVVVIAFLISCPSIGDAEPLRAIELDPQAPDSIVSPFAEAGVNTVVVLFRKQGDLEDAAFQESLARWGRLAARYKLRAFVAIRLFGPPDYTGCNKEYRRARDVMGGGPCVCPTDPSYWAEVVVPRLRRAAELAKKNQLAGALLDFQATLAGHEYNPMFCYCNGCWLAFTNAKRPQDEKVAKLSGRARLDWLRSAGAGMNYFDFLSSLAETEMKSAAQAARTAFPQMELGIYGYWNTWFYRGVARGLSPLDLSTGSRPRATSRGRLGATLSTVEGSQDGHRPPAVMTEHERCSVGKLRGLMLLPGQMAGLDLRPVACLPLDYYLPRDVQNQLAELDRESTGFMLTSTDSLWRRLGDDFHIYPPHGSVEAFANAVRNGLGGHGTSAKGGSGDRSTLFNKPHPMQFIPRIGFVCGKGVYGVLSDTLVQLAEGFQLPCLRLDAGEPEGWQGALSAFEAVIVMPGAVRLGSPRPERSRTGAGAANPTALTQAAPDFIRFLQNGGLAIVLNGADRAQLDWLAHHDQRFALQGETRLGVRQAWLDDQDEMMVSPTAISHLEPLAWHFTSFAKEYQSLAKDTQGCSYLLRQRVGKGLLVVSAGPLMPPELLVNAWSYFAKRSECYNVGLIPGSDLIRFGANELLLRVAEYPESAKDVDLTVDVVDSQGKTETHRLPGVSLAGDGIQAPFRYAASQEGAGRVIVTITDPVDNALIRRFFINLPHDHRVEAVLDKNYYTTEQTALLQLRFHDESLRDVARCAIRWVNDILPPSAASHDHGVMAIPIASLPPGEHRLQITFLKEGKPLYSRELSIRKEEPFPTAVKVLHHRNCVLEVEGRPFFPFGCYGIRPEQEEELAQVGVNTTIAGHPSKERRLMVASSDLRKWAASNEWTAQKVRDNLRTPEYGRLLAWYMFDEPELNSQSPEHVMKTYVSGRAKDPYHPQMAVYIGSMAYPHYPDYVASDECQMMDDYPLPYFSSERFGDLLARLAEATRGRRVLWAVPQCFDWRDLGASIGPHKPESLAPSGQEALNYIYQSIVHGAGAITFWTYRYAAADPRRHEALKKALAEGSRLTRLVTEGTVVSAPRIKPFCARIRCRSFQLGTDIYIVAVNPTNRTATVEFSAPYLAGKRLREWLPTARLSSPKSPRQLDGLTDTFNPLEGKTYLIESPQREGR